MSIHPYVELFIHLEELAAIHRIGLVRAWTAGVVLSSQSSKNNSKSLLHANIYPGYSNTAVEMNRWSTVQAFESIICGDVRSG